MIKFKNVEYENILKNISFNIEKNKYNVITGENGSGKSTIAKLIIGLIKIQNGEILIDGEKIEYSRKKLFEIRKKIGVVFKEIDEQVIGTTVLESLVFGMENNRLCPEKMRENIEKYCKIFEIEHLLERKISELSGGEKQKIALVSVIVVEPEILILDEAMEMLDENNKKKIKNFLREYVKIGKTVISITHNLEEIEKSDKIIYIEKNGKVFEGKHSEILEKLEYNKGKIFEKAKIIEKTNTEKFKNKLELEFIKEKSAIIELKNVGYSYNKKEKVIENLNLLIVENEINAIIGKSGRGKTTLIELIFGLLSLEYFEGEIKIKDKKITKNTSENELADIRENMGILFQDVEKQFFENTVLKEIEYNISKKKNTKAIQKEKIQKLLNEVGLDESYLSKSPFALSDGEKKLVGILMVLVTEPKILFLDEPTVNLDFKMTDKIVKIMKRLVEKGVTIILITHDEQLLKNATNIIDLD